MGDDENDESISEAKTEVSLTPAEEMYVVRVVVKDIPGEVKTFGPFPKEEAEMAGEDIRSGNLLLNFALLPPSIEAVFVEREEEEVGGN